MALNVTRRAIQAANPIRQARLAATPTEADASANTATYRPGRGAAHAHQVDVVAVRQELCPVPRALAQTPLPTLHLRPTRHAASLEQTSTRTKAAQEQAQSPLSSSAPLPPAATEALDTTTTTKHQTPRATMAQATVPGTTVKLADRVVHPAVATIGVAVRLRMTQLVTWMRLSTDTNSRRWVSRCSWWRGRVAE